MASGTILFAPRGAAPRAAFVIFLGGLEAQLQRIVLLEGQFAAACRRPETTIPRRDFSCE